MSRRSRLTLIAGLVTFLSTIPVHAQNIDAPRTRTLPGIEDPAFPYAEPGDDSVLANQLAQLGDEITEWVANGDLVGAELLVVKENKAVFHEAYGWSDRENRDPVERNSIWSIKSMSKPFTATAILMLADEGKISLEDRVSEYIPSFYGNERTTIGHLLSHTSGYRNEDLGDPVIGLHDDFGTWVEEWAAKTPSGTFGEYEYTDFSFAAAGYIVEAVSGMPIGRFTEEQIVKPLGLHNTRTYFSDDPAWKARLNPWYRWNDAITGYELRWGTDRVPWPFYNAAWGMFSTAMDYAEFTALWMSKGEFDGVRLLEDSTVTRALRPYGWSNGDAVYGYGWFVNGTQDASDLPRVFYHGGGDGTHAVAFPSEDLIVIWLTHSRDGPHTGALLNRLGALEIVEMDQDMIPIADFDETPTSLSTEMRLRYVGTYRGEDNASDRDPRIWEENGRLKIRLGQLGRRADYRFDLIPLGGDRFALGRYRDGRPYAVDPLYGIRFRSGESVENGDREKSASQDAVQLLAGENVLFTAPRVDAAELDSIVHSLRNQVSIAQLIAKTLETEGIEAAKSQHRMLLASRPDSVVFHGTLLNTLAFRYLTASRHPEAFAVFEMNAEAYPDNVNAHVSLAEAYLAAGNKEEARSAYARAVEIAEQSGHPNVNAYRAKLGQVQRQLDEK